MNLKCKINGIEYTNLVQGINISEEYNETLDSASIILSDVAMIKDLKPYDDVYIYDGEFNGYGENYKLPSFFLHFLIDQFTEEMLNPSKNADEIRYKYKIDLMSETKKLETIQLPNFSITQPLDIEKKKTVYSYIVDILDLYNPMYKVGKDGEWHYQKKYFVDASIKEIFDKVYSPDFTLNTPNLRDVLTKLMMTKDKIPVVKNDVITCLDISKRNGEFDVNIKYISSIVGSRSSDNHCDGLRRVYNNALSQDSTCKMVEFLGFRNSDSGMLTLENLRLETRYPIYKINKIYMCYYKKIKVVDKEQNPAGEKIFLCKQDISKFVKMNNERNLLSEDWVDFEKKVNSGITLDELSKYKLATVGYDIGSNFITGWGIKYNYVESRVFDKTKTYVENILRIIDEKNPYGIYNYGYITSSKDFYFNGDGYIISGLSGSLADRVVNVYSNLALFMKSLFFEVDYNAFYNGSIIHSKDNARDDIIMNDNSGSSLTLLEQDGVYQKEKVNRFGNKAIQINATYDDFSQLQPLGSVYNYGNDKDVIIYHREISINDNVINCVYYGTQDYVLKNYFTSVNAKHRPFNLMSYGESVRRSENKKMYLMMSKDKYYYENENIVLNIDNSFINKFLSFYKESELGLSKGNFIFGEKINYGYFVYNNEKYASDINAFTSGSSMCFNIAMYDNVSGGVYIDATEEKLEPVMNFTPELSIDGALGMETKLKYTSEKEDYMRGSVQKWHITSNEETGFAENMGFYVAHNDFNDLFSEKKVLDDNQEDNVKKIIKEHIMVLPKIYSNIENTTTNIIGNEFKINKDNKELIDMTFQFELLSDSEDILFSPWILRLSDLLGNYLKFANDKTAEDFEVAESPYQIITSTAVHDYYYNYGESNQQSQLRFDPIMVLQFPESALKKIEPKTFVATFEFSEDVSGKSDYDKTTKDLIYYKFETSEIINYNEEEGIIELKGKQNLKFDGGFLGIKPTPYNDEAVLTLKRIDRIGLTDVPEGYVWFSNCQVNYGGTNKLFYDVQYFGDNGVLTYDDGNKKLYINNELSLSNFYCSTKKTLDIENGFGMEEDSFDINNYEIQNGFFVNKNDAEETLYYQNMFVITSANELKKEVVYDELLSISDYSAYRPNEFFSIEDNPNGNGGKRLKVNCANGAWVRGSDGRPIPAKSISVWYKDELSYENNTEGLITTGEKGYHFVFGINTGFVTVPSDIYINLSLLSKKDRRVFDEGHNLIGYVKNESNSTELVSTQRYELIDKGQ